MQKKAGHKSLKILKFVLLFGMLAVLITILAVLLKNREELQTWNEDAVNTVAESGKADFNPEKASYVYDKDGNELAKISDAKKTTYLEYDDIPEDVVNAFVAVEDRSFWDNKGYDLKGIFRVSLNFITTKGEVKNGASTITQQLARLQYLTNEVSMKRKIREIMFAIQLTKKYSKEDIIEFYINNCCFGNNIYGIEAAARIYFGCSARELSLAQITYLCAIPNRPTYYDPYKEPGRAVKRQNKILTDMVECGYITEADRLSAKRETIQVLPKQGDVKEAVNNYQTTYAIHCAVEFLMKEDGFTFGYDFDSEEDYKEYRKKYKDTYALYQNRFNTGGYKIYTSLDSTAQINLQNTIDENLSVDDSVGESGVYALQGAATAIDNETGKVIAVVGGRSQNEFNSGYTLNRAYQSYRQPGSSIKPIAVYAPAMMQGYTPDSTVQNIDVEQAKKSKDVSAMSGASMSLRSAVEQSKNGCAYQVMNAISPKFGLSFLKEMQFDEIVPSDENLSAALGGLTYGVTTEQMAGAYATLVNQGVYRQTTCITSIKDIHDKEIYEEPVDRQVYSREAAVNMINIMEGVIKKGTAAKIGWSRVSKVAAAGKTGTTNDSKDGWFCGVTPYYTIAVWVGYDTPKTLSGLYGSTYPATIWKAGMQALLEESDFTQGSFTGGVVASSSGSTDGTDAMAGRSDDEVLSEGYTVGDYRADREIGQRVNAVITQMDALSKSQEDYQARKDELYRQGCEIVGQIYSRKYTAEKQGDLDNAYTR